MLSEKSGLCLQVTPVSLLSPGEAEVRFGSRITVNTVYLPSPAWLLLSNSACCSRKVDRITFGILSFGQWEGERPRQAH